MNFVYYYYVVNFVCSTIVRNDLDSPSVFGVNLSDIHFVYVMILTPAVVRVDLGLLLNIVYNLP